MEITLNHPENNNTNLLPIVAIGASAGGIEAMLELLNNLHDKVGMSFVYVQHLSRDHTSDLAAVLGRATTMPVVEARDEMPLEADHLYVIAPDTELTIVDGHLKTDVRPEAPFANSPINKFFYSLAENYSTPVIGIILSGAATDGVLGLKALKVAGGLTFAQGSSAGFESMPQGAIAEGAVDLVLSPKEIAEELTRISTQKNIFQFAVNELSEESINNRDQHLLSILHVLNRSVGVDFRFYKMNTIKRRIIRRMMLHKLDNLEDYLHYIRQNATEINLLYQDLLINVTTFFRDPPAIDFLKQNIITEIAGQKAENDPIRLWVPACSTGQEAYSLAMLFVEVLGDRIGNIPIQVFATDLSEQVINKARLGIYSKEDVSEISTARLQRFFTRTEGSYRIVKSIRDMCVFATHNVAKDPPFSRIDLVSCCNLLIYLDAALQKKVMASFHYALNSNGFLLLGKSETATTATNLFTPVDKKVKIYAKKKDASVRAMFEMNFHAPEPSSGSGLSDKKPARKISNPDMDLEKIMNHLLLTKYVPASVLVNADLDILQFRGSTGLFLEPAPGRASLNLLKMARTSLGFELRNIVHKAKSTGQPVKKEHLELKQGDKFQRVNIEAVPVKSDADEQYFLVVFEQVLLNDEALAGDDANNDARVKQLERELSALREDMRAIVEAQEAANEELQSANEEIVSSNEELQSINEELETSKEELESSNEELITINQELHIRNEQLAESQDYAEAVFGTIRESLIILDKSFRVKRANATFYTTFGLKEQDTEGRMLFELGNGQWNIPLLREFLYDILPQQVNATGFEVKHSFASVGEKVMLFNASTIARRSQGEDIILLAIEDITGHRRSERMLAEREQWLRNMADNAPVMMWVTGTDKLNMFVNKAYLDYRGITLEHAVGKLWTEHIHPEDLDKCLKTYQANFDQKKPYVQEYRLLHHDGSYRWILDHAKPSFTPEGSFTGFIGSCVDIHEQRLGLLELERRIEERTRALLDANTELERSHSELQQFAYVATHDLQEPLRKVLTFIDRIEEGYTGQMPDELQRYFKKVHDAIQLMTRLLDDLLNFSRISRLTRHFIKTDLNVILQNVISDLDDNILEKGAIVQAEPLPEIQGIPLQLAQLFHHLLNNALKFSNAGVQPKIEVTSRSIDQRDLKDYPQLLPNLSYMEIIFRDNGIGFSPEYAEQIFGIFQRLNQKETFTGTGIGLSLCRKIVSNHNGLIYAVGKEGEGAEFHVVLPVQQNAG